MQNGKPNGSKSRHETIICASYVFENCMALGTNTTAKTCKFTTLYRLNQTKGCSWALLNFHIFNKPPMHKQHKIVLDHLQALRIAVGFSDKSRKIVAQQPVHSLDGVRVCFSSERFGWVDEIVCAPMVRCIKAYVNMANFSVIF